MRYAHVHQVVLQSNLERDLPAKVGGVLPLHGSQKCIRTLNVSSRAHTHTHTHIYAELRLLPGAEPVQHRDARDSPVCL